MISSVNGSKEAILNTQRSFEHLFQRPGAKELTVDANRTSLTGTGGTLRLGKTGGKAGKLGQVFKFETGLTFRSPELELNDIGFMLTSNEINHFTWAGLHYQKPFSFFRNARLNYNHWLRWDYSGQLLYQQMNMNSHGTFNNNWQTGTSVTWNPYDISNTALRGAGSLRRPSGIGWSYYVETDYRKKIAGGFNLFRFWGFDNNMDVKNIELFAYIVPINAFSINLSTSFENYWRRQDQFVQNVSYNNSTRTIVAQVKQQTLRFTGRLSYNVTPDLTIQYYGQPFITRPEYKNFAYVSNPMAKTNNERFTIFNTSQVNLNDGIYYVDENNDNITDYSFYKPDFNFVQFRSNLIIRWEYRAGSELFLVWADGNTPNAYADLDTPVFKSLLNNAFTSGSRNSFLVKWTYRFLK